MNMYSNYPYLYSLQSGIAGEDIWENSSLAESVASDAGGVVARCWVEVWGPLKTACSIGQRWVCLMDLDVQEPWNPWNRGDGEDETFMMLIESL